LDKTLGDIWIAFRNGQIAVTSVAENISLPQKAMETIQRRYEEWVHEMQNKDTAQYLLKTRADIRRCGEQLNELQLRLRMDANHAQSEETTRSIARIKGHMDRLRGEVARIESGSLCYEDISQNLRFVAVFSVES